MERAYYDEMEDRLTVERVEDVSSVLEKNKRAFDVDNKRFGKGPMHHVARIPVIVIDKIRNETGIDLLKDEKALKTFLNDPDNRLFRTRPGRI